MWIVEVMELFTRLSKIPPKLITVFAEDNYVFLVLEFDNVDNAKTFINVIKPTIDKINRTLSR